MSEKADLRLEEEDAVVKLVAVEERDNVLSLSIVRDELVGLQFSFLSVLSSSTTFKFSPPTERWYSGVKV